MYEKEREEKAAAKAERDARSQQGQKDAALRLAEEYAEADRLQAEEERIADEKFRKRKHAEECTRRVKRTLYLAKRFEPLEVNPEHCDVQKQLQLALNELQEYAALLAV